jgi:hypothetical protein
MNFVQRIDNVALAKGLGALASLASVDQVQQCRLTKLEENFVSDRIGGTLVDGGPQRIKRDATVQGQTN